ncbi:hypothetical protein F8388_008565 [Cannabis sativa]|uniref:Uncharacterized protein n=1 Tax=Cannabis sativa TaxID=3483 RepID=A0A7J6E692_CANSA|nr:hypothetical protein F8388_008565 [Cannabis sativa]
MGKKWSSEEVGGVLAKNVDEEEKKVKKKRKVCPNTIQAHFTQKLLRLIELPELTESLQNYIIRQNPTFLIDSKKPKTPKSPEPKPLFCSHIEDKIKEKILISTSNPSHIIQFSISTAYPTFPNLHKALIKISKLDSSSLIFKTLLFIKTQGTNFKP